MNSHTLRRLMDECLLQHDFCYRGKSDWVRDFPELIQIANVQKSTLSGQYYVNLGIYLRTFGELKNPKEYQCQVRARLDGFLEISQRQYFRDCLRFDNNRPVASIDESTSLISTCLREFAVPFFLNNTTVNSVKLTLRARKDKATIVLMAQKNVREAMLGDM